MASPSSSRVSRINSNKPHVMCIPYPIQDHIKSMLKLAKILHSFGFRITFVNTDFSHNNLLKSRAIEPFAKLRNFSFETIPAVLPPPPATSAPDYYHLLCQSAREKFLPPLHNLITRLNWCKTVSCIISDGLMPFNIMIARELGILGYLLWVPNACAFMGYLQEKGLMPPKDEQPDMVLHTTSVLKNIRLGGIPRVKVYENDPTREEEEAFQASGIIFETFEALERDIFNAIKPMFQNVFAIGPLQMLLNSTSARTHNDHIESVSLNQHEDEIRCLKWLDSKKPETVVYINFGDQEAMAYQQLREFAWGICNSNQQFLWKMSSDFLEGPLPTLPLEFLEKTKERGLIAKWCPHEQVLAHPSVGAYVSDFGTSSMLESICAGVPMIGWPCHGDHQLSCIEWGVGTEIDEDTKREEVETLVREVMEGDKGKEMKRKVTEWKKLAVEATGEGGSSGKNFDSLMKALSGSQNFMGHQILSSL